MDSSINDWLVSLAAKTPTPGGGAVAALTTAIAAAQLGMVAIYTTGSKWQDREKRMQELVTETAEIRAEALALMQADADAFTQVGTAYQLPKDTDDERTVRTALIQQALIAAANPPSRVVLLATRIIDIAFELAEKGNPNVISDVAVVASVACAGLKSAIVNIEINELSITDPITKENLRAIVQKTATVTQKADDIIKNVRKQLQ